MSTEMPEPDVAVMKWQVIEEWGPSRWVVAQFDTEDYARIAALAFDDAWPSRTFSWRRDPVHEIREP